MLRGGYNLGGEQSGHVLFLDHTTTGDGLITALAILGAAWSRAGQPLSELRGVMQRFPQVLRQRAGAREAGGRVAARRVARADRRRRSGRSATAGACWCATPAPRRCCA